MKEERSEELEAERTPEEIEHFMERKKVMWAIASRTPVFFPPSSEDSVFGRPRKRRAAERGRGEGEG